MPALCGTEGLCFCVTIPSAVPPPGVPSPPRGWAEAPAKPSLQSPSPSLVLKPIPHMVAAFWKRWGKPPSLPPSSVCFNAVRKENRACAMALPSSVGKNGHLGSSSPETWDRERLSHPLLTRLFPFLTFHQDRSGFNHCHHFSSA